MPQRGERLEITSLVEPTWEGKNQNRVRGPYLIALRVSQVPAEVCAETYDVSFAWKVLRRRYIHFMPSMQYA